MRKNPKDGTCQHETFNNRYKYVKIQNIWVVKRPDFSVQTAGGSIYLTALEGLFQPFVWWRPAVGVVLHFLLMVSVTLAPDYICFIIINAENFLLN